MLIQFSVENFRSIKEEARLSLEPGPGKERFESNLMRLATRRRGSPTALLRSAAIYGANAAGKTNILRALATMRSTVTDSSREPGTTIPVTPFLFDPACRQKPSTFEIICLVDGVRYQYGFSATSERVTDEWLYASPLGRIQLWFERTLETWKLGDKLTGDREVWRRATRSDALFLSTAVSLNSKQLHPIFNWFKKTLHVVTGSLGDDFSMYRYLKDGKSGLIDFLQAADFGITDLRLVEQEFTPEMLPALMPTEPMEQVVKDLSGKKIAELWLSHDTEAGPTELSIVEESDGTQKVFALAGPWLDSLENGYVVVVDELHDNLHPVLVRFLVDRFHDPRVNVGDAQLIFSTHDTSILSQDVFRRDQIWFCERNRNQETTLFPLADFHPRKGVENLERAYLSGRYGALPYIDGDAVTWG